MKLRILLLVGFMMIYSFASFSQTKVATAAETYVAAFIDSDIETLFSLTHPNIISMGGGEKYVMEDIRRERMAFDNMNMVFESGIVGTPSIPVTENDELQVIIPVTYLVKLNDESFESYTALFAASSDDGETWRFVNLDQHDRESLKLFVPNLSNQIQFPKKKGFQKIETTDK